MKTTINVDAINDGSISSSKMDSSFSNTYQLASDKVIEVNKDSTDDQYPSAKSVYNFVQNEIADEKINLTMECEDPSAIIGAIATLTYEGAEESFTWGGGTSYLKEESY